MRVAASNSSSLGKGGSVKLLVVGGEGGDGGTLPVVSDKGVSGDKLLVVGVEGVGDDEGGGVKLLGSSVFDSSFLFLFSLLRVHN